MNRFQTVKRPDFTRLPELPLPFYVRSSGHFRLDPGWSGPGGGDSPYAQVFWGVAGKGTLRIEGQDLDLAAGSVAFMMPGEGHFYIAGDAPWELRWFTFDGPAASSFLRSYGYPRINSSAGPCPHTLFDELEDAMRKMTPFRQRRLVALAAELLALAGGSDEDGSRHGRLASRFVELAQANYSNGMVNVNSLAEIMGVHRSTLNRVFKERMLISPGDYLARLRMQHALAMLKESDRSVSEIAELSGMPNPTCFCRAVRRATGASPSEYRRS